MKSKVNLTIDNGLLENTKQYAQKHHISISELASNYFKSITRPVKRKTIIDLVSELDKPNINVNDDLKELYYQDKKHGF